MLAAMGNATLAVARDTDEGDPRKDYQVRVATRTARPRKAYTIEVPASDNAVRLNPGGWTRR